MNITRGLLALVVLSLGCSLLSESITSPSESVTGTGRAIGGSFQSLSTSASQELSIDARRSAYVRDLRAYVAGFARSGAGSAEDFLRGVSRVAESHGISHWEAEPATPYAIGQGLRDADASESELRALGGGSRAAGLALEGWREAGL
jgi:hypothetical protein